jgi:hypothetical protein
MLSSEECNQLFFLLAYNFVADIILSALGLRICSPEIKLTDWRHFRDQQSLLKVKVEIKICPCLTVRAYNASSITAPVDGGEWSASGSG